MDKGEKIYDNIKRLAYAKGLTINELCKKSKVSRGLLGDLEHGRRISIGNITVEKLVKVLGCTKENILTQGSLNMPEQEAPKDKRFDNFLQKAMVSLQERPEMRKLVRAAMKANEAQVKSTAVLLESIVDLQTSNGFHTTGGDEIDD